MSTEMEYDDKLDLLLRLGSEISRENDLGKLLGKFGDFSRDIVEAQRCSIFIHDAKRNELWTMFSHGVEEIRMAVNLGVAGYAANTREIQIVTDAYKDFRFSSTTDKKLSYVTNTILAVPLFDKKDNVIGVIEAINKKQGFFTNIDAELLLLLSQYVSTTLENVFLHNKLRDTNTKLISKLSTAAEFKDDESSKHTTRVALYSKILAEGYGLQKDETEVIKLVSPLHDAGNIGIPNSILKKPAQLTIEEFEIVKTHSIIGYNILKDEDNDILQIAATIARDHHERWDGTGYPNRTKGHNISIHGRMVAIADVFDALTSMRPHRAPWTIEKTIELLIAEKGKHFEPYLVDIFVSKLKEVKEIYTEYKEE
ncbi:response regulator receiver modulated metal dependent phosphohydrolase [Candidatus Magnetobacterium bavaricum]|uniref:Response regulator receiver modulated metal dependent phosphohydrolase n=1 Tax=Candidatus Magnetobacterium bavaricum TaxID=29290 RepID=A0A0F3GYH8_9BACT|nr:response regulator receiver modulated metal dependent phosphohydrolase [Candidatus Magnetobacterium bavaricum]